MNTYRRSALAAGALLIVATVATVVLGGIALKPVVGDPVDLAKVGGNETQVFLGALLNLIGAAACPAIVIALYPVLRVHSPALALGSVAFRVIEATFYVISVVGLLLLVTLSREAAKAGAADAAFYGQLAALLVAGRAWLGFVAAVVFAGLGTLLYDWVLYRSALVPRWLSGWGVAAAVGMLVAALLAMFGVAPPLSPVHIVLNLPIAVQEMALAVWLIARGFSQVAVAAAVPPTAFAGAAAR
jgi:Domain of unknown function (DUF4386)